jgi:DNA-binding beta-propeller fold protein YncE
MITTAVHALGSHWQCTQSGERTNRRTNAMMKTRSCSSLAMFSHSKRINSEILERPFNCSLVLLRMLIFVGLCNWESKSFCNAFSLRYPLVPLTSRNAPSPYVVQGGRDGGWNTAVFYAFDHIEEPFGDECGSPCRMFHSPEGDYSNGVATLNTPVTTSYNLETAQSSTYRGDYIQIYLGAAIKLGGFSFCSRYEATGRAGTRAPSDFVISGSNDQSTWYTIDTRSDTPAYFKKNFDIPLSRNVAMYTSFRVSITKVTGGNLGDFINLVEWRLIAVCPTGWFCDSSFKAVRLCLRGRFCTQSSVFADSTEQECPPGTYNPLFGMSSISACLPCPAGLACPSGSFVPAESFSLRYPPVPLTWSNSPSPFTVHVENIDALGDCTLFPNACRGSPFFVFDHIFQAEVGNGPLRIYHSPEGDYLNGLATSKAPVSTSYNSETLQTVSCRGDFIQIYLGAAIRLGGYSLWPRYCDERGPSDFVISGSNDASSWYTVDVRSGISICATSTFDIPASKQAAAALYSSYRICTSRVFGSPGPYLNLAEWRLIRACNAGWFCTSLFVAVRPCLPGRFCNQSSVFADSSEHPCPAGTYNPVSGMSNISACLPCPSGPVYCPSSGASSPTPCVSGFYCNATSIVGACSSNCAACSSAAPTSCIACIAPFIMTPGFYCSVTVTTLAGSSCGSFDGIGTSASFCAVFGLAISPDGTFALLGDASHNRVRRLTISTGAVTTLAGSGSPAHTDAIGTLASFNGPYGIAISPDGSFALVADVSNQRVRKIVIGTGVVTTLAGTGTPGNSDGPGLSASFWTPLSVAISPNSVFALVTVAGTDQVRRVEIATGAVSTLAGTRDAPDRYSDGHFSAARFWEPCGVDISPDGTFAVVADRRNNRVRRVSIATGEVTTLASSVSFSEPMDVAISPDGKFVLVTERGNSRRIRCIMISGGIVTTLAGSGAATFSDGIGPSVSFLSLLGVAIAPDGSYALVTDDNRVRRAMFQSPCPAGFYCPRGSSVPILCFASFCNSTSIIGACSPNCATCTSGAPASCTACIAPSVLVRRGVGCVPTCPAGYENVTGVCRLCSSNCSTCSSLAAASMLVSLQTFGSNTPPVGLVRVVGSLSGWVWGVDAGDLLYACAPPCNGTKWNQVSPPPSVNGPFLDLVVDESISQAPRLFVLYPSASMSSTVCQASTSTASLISFASLPVSGVGMWNTTLFTSRTLSLTSQLNVTASAAFALINAQSTVGYFLTESGFQAAMLSGMPGRAIQPLHLHAAHARRPHY